MADLCITLVGVVKDHIQDFRGFPKEKEDSLEVLRTIEIVLKHASIESLMSNSSSFEESKALEQVLCNITTDLNKLKKLIKYCEKKPILTTYVIPSKQRNKWQGLIESIGRNLSMLNLCIANTTKMNTQDIKTDTKDLRNVTQDIKSDTTDIKVSLENNNADTARQMEQMNARLTALLGAIDNKKIDIDFNSMEETYSSSVKAAAGGCSGTEASVLSADALEALLHKARDLQNTGKYQDALSEFAKYYAICRNRVSRDIWLLHASTRSSAMQVKSKASIMRLSSTMRRH